MILYNNRDVRVILFYRAGTVIFTPNVLIPAALSTIICALILQAPDMKVHLIISGSVVRIYATILGFVIVFRTNMAFNRYFDGVEHLKAMFSKWRDAFTSLCVFMETSSKVFEKDGKFVFVRELAESKARVVHWFSMLTAIATLKLKGIEGHAEGLSTKPMPQNRVSDSAAESLLGPDGRQRPARNLTKPSLSSNPSVRRQTFKRLDRTATNDAMQLRPPFTCCEDLREHAFLTYGSNALVLGNISPEEMEALNNAEDDVLCVMRWLKLEISEHSIAGRLLIGPPILSRVFQELSAGMFHFFMGMKVVFVPFPFPFAQFLQYALIAFIVFCPFAILPSLDETSEGLRSTWPALLMNFFSVAGFVALNEIAVELEDPFGEDANDYPLHQEQWNIIWAIEDCYYTSTPREFDVSELGAEAVIHVAKAEHVVKKTAARLKKEKAAEEAAVMPQGPTPNPPPPSIAAKSAKPSEGSVWCCITPTSEGPHSEIEALVPSFKALRDLVAQSVGALKGLGNKRREELDGMSRRLQELLPEHQGEQTEPNWVDGVVQLPWLKGLWKTVGGSLEATEDIQQVAPVVSDRSEAEPQAGLSSLPVDVGQSSEHGDDDQDSDGEGELQRLVHEHASLTRRLRAVLRSAQQGQIQADRV